MQRMDACHQPAPTKSRRLGKRRDPSETGVLTVVVQSPSFPLVTAKPRNGLCGASAPNVTEV
jgi:hypothetical protein